MSASTVILNGLTTHDYGTYYPYFAIRNDSGGIVYASTTDPECTPDAEGVVSIANGDGYIAANTDHDNTCLYLSGTGKVTVIAQHDKIFPFKKTQKGGGTVIVEKDYEELINKPSINGVPLTQNKTFEDLGDHVLSNLEIMAIFNQVWK